MPAADDGSSGALRVSALWRYPVKSMQGLAVDAVDVGPLGIDGDRRWALRDAESGRLLSAKRYRRLLEATADDAGVVLPDGSRVGHLDRDAASRLGTWIGRPVDFEPVAPETKASYEMTFDPPNDDAEYVEIPSPVGTFLDAAEVHLISEPTLRRCADERPDLDWDVRRFRPNVVVDGPLDPFAEDGWCGRELRVGTAVLAARQPTVRCAVPLRAQPGLDRQLDLYRALEDLHANHLGIYLGVVEPGTVRIGDRVHLATADA